LGPPSNGEYGKLKQGNPQDAEKVLKLWLELFPRRAGVGEAAQALATLKPIS